MVWFDAFRSELGPTWYGENRTAVVTDTRTLGIFAVFAVLFSAFLLVFPGIRRRKWSSFLSVTLSLSVGSVLLAAIFYPAWSRGSLRIYSTYRSFSADKLDAVIGVTIGLSELNITLLGRSNTSETGVEIDLDYNERFDFSHVRSMEVELAKGLGKGLPYPMLSVIEYLSVDRAGFIWGRQYRLAGYYTCILLWLSFGVWLLSLLVLVLAPELFSRALVCLGSTTITADLVYLAASPTKLAVAYSTMGQGTQFLRFGLGWCFWATTTAGVLCLLAGLAIRFLELRLLYEFTTFLQADMELKYGSEGRSSGGRLISSNSSSLQTPHEIRRRKDVFVEGAAESGLGRTSHWLRFQCVAPEELSQTSSPPPSLKGRAREPRLFATASSGELRAPAPTAKNSGASHQAPGVVYWDDSDPCVCLPDDADVPLAQLDSYNFCYGPSGKAFGCGSLPTLRHLHILDWDEDQPQGMRVPEPVLVIAAGPNTFQNSLRAMLTAQVNQSDYRIIFYDLGLPEDSQMRIRYACGVEYRRFPFELFPKMIMDLDEERWKPILIAQTLSEFGAIWYFDYNDVWQNASLRGIYNRFNDVHLDWKYLEDEGRFRTMKLNKEYDLFLYGHSSTGILTLTDPKLFDWLPSKQSELAEAEIFSASPILAVWNRDVALNIIKWLVLCALDTDCWRPSKLASTGCRPNPDNDWSRNLDCHRPLQATLNVLLWNRLHNSSLYLLPSNASLVERDYSNAGFILPHMCLVFDENGELKKNYSSDARNWLDYKPGPQYGDEVYED